jgi:membrane associated rhomboid family serine protease
MDELEIVATQSPAGVAEVSLVLRALAMEGRWRHDEGVYTLLVPERIATACSEALSDALLERPAPRAEPIPNLLLHPPFVAAFCLAGALIAFFWVTGTAAGASPWFELGELVPERFWAGEWWRIMTAATLHADWGHMLGNASFLLVLGWGAGERVGPGVMLGLFLATAAGGFAVDMAIGPAARTLGASGGLFGLLGVAAGHGVRSVHGSALRVRQRMRAFGAASMLLAWTAFSPESNVTAHVGGFLIGVVLGVMFPGRPNDRWQAATALLSLVLIGSAWAAALGW